MAAVRRQKARDGQVAVRSDRSILTISTCITYSRRRRRSAGFWAVTSGFEARAGGVGIRLEDAIDRAMGELLERYASLAFDGGDRIVSSYAALRREGRRVVPFETLVPFSREQQLDAGFPYAEFHRRYSDRMDRGHQSDRWLSDPGARPIDLIRLCSRSTDEVSPCFYPTSSGCAAGASLAGALLSGLLELIERDAIMVRWYARLAPPLLEIEAADLLGASVGLQTDGLEVRFHDLTMDGDVPVVGVTCVERTGRPCFFLLSAAGRPRRANCGAQGLAGSRAGPPVHQDAGQPERRAGARCCVQ